MKIFWLKMVLIVVLVYVSSGAIFLIPHLGSLGTITYLSLLAWFGGTTLGLAIWLVPYSVVMLWMFRRIATRQGVEVEDVVYALYMLKWYFNRVAYDMNFPADYAEARRESLDFDPKEKE